MAEAQYQDFDRRMRRIVKNHRRLDRGFVAAIDENGLLVAKPQRALPRISYSWMIGMLTMLFMFKVYLFAVLGPTTYDERVTKLANGTVIEQAGAFVMQADPLTVWVAGQFDPIR